MWRCLHSLNASCKFIFSFRPQTWQVIHAITHANHRACVALKTLKPKRWNAHVIYWTTGNQPVVRWSSPHFPAISFVYKIFLLFPDFSAICLLLTLILLLLSLFIYLTLSLSLSFNFCQFPPLSLSLPHPLLLSLPHPLLLSLLSPSLTPSPSCSAGWEIDFWLLTSRFECRSHNLRGCMIKPWWYLLTGCLQFDLFTTKFY